MPGLEQCSGDHGYSSQLDPSDPHWVPATDPETMQHVVKGLSLALGAYDSALAKLGTVGSSGYTQLDAQVEAVKYLTRMLRAEAQRAYRAAQRRHDKGRAFAAQEEKRTV